METLMNCTCNVDGCSSRDWLNAAPCPPPFFYDNIVEYAINIGFCKQEVCELAKRCLKRFPTNASSSVIQRACSPLSSSTTSPLPSSTTSPLPSSTTSISTSVSSSTQLIATTSSSAGSPHFLVVLLIVVVVVVPLIVACVFVRRRRKMIRKNQEDVEMSQHNNTSEGSKRTNSTYDADDDETIELSSGSEHAPDHDDGDCKEIKCDDVSVSIGGGDGCGKINDDGHV